MVLLCGLPQHGWDCWTMTFFWGETRIFQHKNVLALQNSRIKANLLIGAVEDLAVMSVAQPKMSEMGHHPTARDRGQMIGWLLLTAWFCKLLTVIGICWASKAVHGPSGRKNLWCLSDNGRTCWIHLSLLKGSRLNFSIDGCFGIFSKSWWWRGHFKSWRLGCTMKLV